MPSFASFLSRRRARVPAGVAGSVALLTFAGAGVWYFTHPASPTANVSPKDLPKGRVLGVQPLSGYETKFSRAEDALLRNGPEPKDKASLKKYRLLRARLEPDRMTRTRMEQEAVIATEGYGHTPPLADVGPQARSAMQAVKDGKNPERLTPLIAPKPFDARAYKRDATAYLEVAEPGRVIQAKATAAGVPAIESVSPYFEDVKLGGSAQLAVKAAPGYPVTFTSFDAGRFAETGLTTATVETDAAGVARVTFEGAPGTVLESNVLATSQMSSGRVRFKLNTLVYADEAPGAAR